MPVPRPDVPGASRADALRVSNARIAASAARHHFDDAAPVPFLCECSEERCEELLRMPVSQYQGSGADGHYLVAPGHQVAGAQLVRVKEICWIYRRTRS